MKSAGILSAFVLSGVLLSGGSAALAQTSAYKDHTHGADIHDSARVRDDMSRWSSEVDWIDMSRRVKRDNGQIIHLEPSITTVNVGYDLTRWLKLYAGGGWGTIILEGGSDSKLFGGLKANWWHNDITDPSFMYGRLSFQSTLEYAHFQAGENPDPFKTEWNEMYVDLTVNYNLILVNRIVDVWRYPYSIAFYAGPAFSSVSGSDDVRVQDAAGTRYVDGLSFEGTESFGMVGGVDLFWSHNFSLGFQGQYFDGETSVVSVDLRYHFH